MEVIDLKKQPKNSRFYSFVLFKKPLGHMKSHEKESIHPTALFPNISSHEDETKFIVFDLQLEEE